MSTATISTSARFFERLVENEVQNIPITCDYYEGAGVLCQGEQAEWVMYRKLCCAQSAYPTLACSRCKDVRVNDDIAVSCSGCGETYEHAADAYRMVERIDRK